MVYLRKFFGSLVYCINFVVQYIILQLINNNNKMEVTIKTKVGTIVFDKLEPGMSMDVNINPGHPVKKARVCVSLYGFRSIHYTQDLGGTTSGRALEDDMVRVGVDIEYKSSKDHIYLEDQEVPIKTKKIKFIDLSTYKVSK